MVGLLLQRTVRMAAQPSCRASMCNPRVNEGSIRVVDRVGKRIGGCKFQDTKLEGARALRPQLKSPSQKPTKCTTPAPTHSLPPFLNASLGLNEEVGGERPPPLLRGAQTASGAEIELARFHVCPSHPALVNYISQY